MAVTINASTTAGLVQTADTSGVLALQTAGTTAVTVDASQNVGIGVTPAAKLDVYNSAAAAANNEILRLRYVTSTTAGHSGDLNFTSNSGTIIGRISSVVQDGNNTSLAFGNYSGGMGERMRLNSTGALVLSGGNTSADGTGITFPATQSASSNANTLDDYEEGTFTPTMSPGSGNWNGATAKGFYTKIGNTVCLQMYLSITDVGTASGVISFGSLPFTAMDPSAGGGNRASVGLLREDGVTGVIYQFFITGGATTGTGYSLTNGAVAQGNGYVYDWIVTYRTS